MYHKITPYCIVGGYRCGNGKMIGLKLIVKTAYTVKRSGKLGDVKPVY
jgi:hypothetical protein